MSFEEIIAIIIYILLWLIIIGIFAYILIDYHKREKVKKMWLKEQSYEIQKVIESYNNLTWEKPTWKHGKNNNSNFGNK